MENQIIDIEKLSPALLAGLVTNGNYLYPAHIAYLDDLLSQAATGCIKRLIINLPPRHGKSELISKYFPFWYLCNFPDKRVILCSYESTFAQSWGKKVRNLISEYGSDYFGIKLSDSSYSASYFEIESYSGSMTCVGAGGSITGRGADIFIIDDPIKNDEEANSQHQREKLWDWFRSTAYTRLEPDGVMVLLMTRWHEDDLCGRIISDPEFSKEWKIISIPAIAQQNDLLGRKQGTSLWKKRFSINKLKKIESEIGSYWFNSLYQQNPVSADGGIFRKKYFRYFHYDNANYALIQGDNIKIVSRDETRICSAVDLAISLSSSADYTVIITIAITPDNEILVLDVFRKRIEPSLHLKTLEEIFLKFNPSLIGIESVQYQTALVQLATSAGLPVKQLKPDADKLTRALPLAAKIENGSVYFLKDAVWLRDFESELMKFPRDKHDDQVDALSYASSFIQPKCSVLPKSMKASRVRG